MREADSFDSLTNKRMKIRHICAVLGVAIAVGTVIFMQGLVATNDHQATAIAERLLREVPVATNAAVAQFAIDYRPNGRVMQGPPLIAAVAAMSELRITNEGRRVRRHEGDVCAEAFAGAAGGNGAHADRAQEDACSQNRRGH